MTVTVRSLGQESDCGLGRRGDAGSRRELGGVGRSEFWGFSEGGCKEDWICGLLGNFRVRADVCRVWWAGDYGEVHRGSQNSHDLQAEAKINSFNSLE